MKKSLFCSVFTLLCSFSGVALADDTIVVAPAAVPPVAPPVPVRNYKINADLSYILNNTKSVEGVKTDKSTLAAHGNYRRIDGIWGEEIYGEAIGGSGTGSKNTERYLAGGKISRQFSPTYYQFVRLQGEKDRATAYDYQVYLTTGVGKEVLRDAKQFMTVELGAGYRYSKLDMEPYGHTNELIGTLVAHYERQLTTTARFAQDFGIDYGSKSQTYRSRTALAMAITPTIAGTVSYQYKRVNSDEGDSHDGLTAFGINYVF